jgi:glycosyltransferase involved in cell wall biosynthesis
MSPTVSVVLPTFNRSTSLVAASRSVLDQSFRELELIIVDDASTEDIAAVARGLGDSRVRCVRRERNGGAGAARNTGLALARGAFIAFQDSDDLWLPGKLEKQVRLLSSLPPEVGAVTGTKVIYGRDARWNYGPGRVACSPTPDRMLRLDEDQLRRILVSNRISLQNALFRADCLPGRDWFDDLLRANVDWDFTVRLAQHAKIHMDSEPVVYSAISRDSVSLNERNKIIAMLRIYNKNKPTYRMYRREHAEMLFQIGISLFRAGRRTSGWRALGKSVGLYPRGILFSSDYIQAYLVNKLNRLVRYA